MEATTPPTAELTPVEEAGFSSSEAEIYRSLSRAAVAALVLGVLGFLAFSFSVLIVLPLLGVGFALLAMRAIRRFPDELQGKKIALAGGALSLFSVVFAPVYHGIVYMTEVPDGYTRLDFAKLKSDSKSSDSPPADALQFDGQQVFIKGYIHPTSMDSVMSKRFVLVPDLGTCCFGSQPPLTHMIEVSLTGDQYARKSFRKQRLAGTLRINRNLKPVEGLNGVFYQLRADILK
jgi:hypothetical protein